MTTITNDCAAIQSEWTALESERVLLERVKQLAQDRVTACELLLAAARQTGDMNQIMAAQINLMAAQTLLQQAIADLNANTLQEYILAGRANANGCNLVSH